MSYYGYKRRQRDRYFDTNYDRNSPYEQTKRERSRINIMTLPDAWNALKEWMDFRASYVSRGTVQAVRPTSQEPNLAIRTCSLVIRV